MRASSEVFSFVTPVEPTEPVVEAAALVLISDAKQNVRRVREMDGFGNIGLVFGLLEKVF